jgi:transmembrane protein TMEM220
VTAKLWTAANAFGLSLLALVAFVWAGYIGRAVHNVPLSALFAEWEMNDLRIEEAREMYGLIIVGAWMTAVAYVNWMRRNRARADV